ncbi:MAG: hypothetical protein EBU84_20855 [Actinobacteria bacterium]|nr:hypothetical protein [Actinomycetota bacterium]
MLVHYYKEAVLLLSEMEQVLPNNLNKVLLLEIMLAIQTNLNKVLLLDIMLAIQTNLNKVLLLDMELVTQHKKPVLLLLDIMLVHHYKQAVLLLSEMEQECTLNAKILLLLVALLDTTTKELAPLLSATMPAVNNKNHRLLQLALMQEIIYKELDPLQ